MMGDRHIGRCIRTVWRSGWAATWLAAGLLSSGIAHAELVDRGGGLIYDTDLNITWLKAANVVAGDWNSVMASADSFSYYDSVRGVTYDDWRLPKVLTPDSTCGGPNNAYHCTGSEMGQLFHEELGNHGYFDPSGNPGWAGWGLLNTGPFEGLAAVPYWSGTVWDQGAFAAYFFEFNLGAQDAFMKSAGLRAMLVRDGDVAAVQVVPAPITISLVGIGLVGVAATRRKHRGECKRDEASRTTG